MRSLRAGSVKREAAQGGDAGVRSGRRVCEECGEVTEEQRQGSPLVSEGRGGGRQDSRASLLVAGSLSPPPPPASSAHPGLTEWRQRKAERVTVSPEAGFDLECLRNTSTLSQGHRSVTGAFCQGRRLRAFATGTSRLVGVSCQTVKHRQRCAQKNLPDAVVKSKPNPSRLGNEEGLCTVAGQLSLTASTCSQDSSSPWGFLTSCAVGATLIPVGHSSSSAWAHRPLKANAPLFQ
nr:uncharacterized protein LOC105885831 isoform X1 [Microcebus murinus]